MNTQSVYLCHKCGGLLTGRDQAPKEFYGCGCISGYVRDFQKPTPISEVRDIQIQECLDRLKGYKEQGRSATNRIVVQTEGKLAALRMAAQIADAPLKEISP